MVLAVKLPKVAVVVLPVRVAPPGLAVIVQLLPGRLLKSTLAVATAQVGCIIVPTTGAGGVAGCALITAFADEPEVQPLDCRVTVKL